MKKKSDKLVSGKDAKSAKVRSIKLRVFSQEIEVPSTSLGTDGCG
jgi:hypothetical protein